MRIYLLTSTDPIAVLVANKLAGEHEVIWQTESKDTWSTLTNPLKRTTQKRTVRYSRFLSLLEFGIFYKLVIEKKLKNIQYNSNSLIREPSSNNINSLIFVNQVKKYNPDLVITLGTSVLKEAWFNDDLKLLNIHTGRLPEYRGRFCWFWPIFNRSYDDIGVSLHELHQKVDAGKVLRFQQIIMQSGQPFTLQSLFIQLAYAHLKLIENMENITWHGNQSEQADDSFTIKFEPTQKELFRGLQHLRRHRVDALREAKST